MFAGAGLTTPGIPSVTWQLMLEKNLLWFAKQHGDSVEVIRRMYAAWLADSGQARSS
jgi:hypothetical protein